MKEYVCTVCGYVHKTEGELSEDFKCPLCGAGKDAFILKESQSSEDQKKIINVDTPHVEKELSPLEMSIICSNLARGCEKQYMNEESNCFKELANFFRSKEQVKEGNIEEIINLLNKDLQEGFPYGNSVAKQDKDRGALRAQVWAEKVTRILVSLLTRYKKEGDKMLENTGVYVCTICGFIYVGDEAPELCPVCKVPSWKFEKIERSSK